MRSCPSRCPSPVTLSVKGNTAAHGSSTAIGTAVIRTAVAPTALSSTAQATALAVARLATHAAAVTGATVGRRRRPLP